MGFIYLIKCNISGECYIGSSMCKNKKDRLYRHRTKYNKCVSKQIINRNDYEYIILEDILDIDKKQLLIKEQEYIDKYNCINKKRAYTTEEEKNKYYENNKEKIKDYQKLYCQNNKEKIKEKRKDYIKEYDKTDKRKEYKKEYHQNNKEKIKKYMKEYHQNNKENNKEYHKEYYFFNKYNDIIAQFINDINQY